METTLIIQQLYIKSTGFHLLMFRFFNKCRSTHHTLFCCRHQIENYPSRVRMRQWSTFPCRNPPHTGYSSRQSHCSVPLLACRLSGKIAHLTTLKNVWSDRSGAQNVCLSIRHCILFSFSPSKLQVYRSMMVTLRYFVSC